ncbi:MAG: metallophosphoesterase [Oscillospiraceae bacterium]|nr:metallophosphoesterase [Oscillospiraceae bacterium]
MKILCIADEELTIFWDSYVPGRLKEYDLILSSGDLKAAYLSFIVTMARAPVMYVHGNHDTGYAVTEPEGCDSIDGEMVEYKGLRILGLGGCLWYRPGDHQYSEKEMRKRIRKLRWKIAKYGGVDIVVTHAPPRGVGDGEDRAHQGFECFLELMDTYRPRYLLHGHVHLSYGRDRTREREYQDTKVINVCEKYVLEIPDGEIGTWKKPNLIERVKFFFGA